MENDRIMSLDLQNVLKKCSSFTQKELSNFLPVVISETGLLNIALVHDVDVKRNQQRVLFKGHTDGCIYISQLEQIPKDAVLCAAQNFDLEGLDLQVVCRILNALKRPMTIYFRLQEGQTVNTNGSTSNKYVIKMVDNLPEMKPKAEPVPNRRRKLELGETPTPKKVKVNGTNGKDQNSGASSTRSGSARSKIKRASYDPSEIKIDYTIPLSENDNRKEVIINHRTEKIGSVLVAATKKQQNVLKSLEVKTGFRHERVVVQSTFSSSPTTTTTKDGSSNNQVGAKKILGAKQGCTLSATGVRMHPRTTGKQLVGCFVDKKYAGFGWWTGLVIEYHDDKKKHFYVVLFKDGSTENFSRKKLHKLFVYRDEVKRYNEWYEYPGYEFVEMEDTGSVNISESTESIDNPGKDVQNKETSNAEGQVMEEIVVEAAAAVSTTKNNDNHETTISENNNNYDIIDVDDSNDDGNFDDSNDANGNMNVSTSLTTTNTSTTRNKTIVNNKNSKTNNDTVINGSTSTSSGSRHEAFDVDADVPQETNNDDLIKWLKKPKLYISMASDALEKFFLDDYYCEVVPNVEYKSSFRYLTFTERMKLLSTADIFISDATRKSDSVYLMELGSAISRNIPLFVHGKIHLEISDQFAFALPEDWKEEDYCIEPTDTEGMSSQVQTRTFIVPQKMVTALNDFICRNSKQINVHLPAAENWGVTFSVVGNNLVVKSVDKKKRNKKIDLKRGDVIYSIDGEVVINSGMRGGAVYDLLARLKEESNVLKDSNERRFIKCVVLRQR